MDLKGMQLGAVFPHNEIGTNPADIKAFAQGVEALGISHLLIYDHVLGADPIREGGFRGPYDKDVAFHEPLTTFAFIAAVTERLEMITTILILPQRQTVLAAKQAAQVALLSNNRFKLGIGVGWNEVEYVGLNEEFSNRGKRQSEQVDLMRRLWSETHWTITANFIVSIRPASNPAPARTFPFGSAALHRHCWIAAPNSATAGYPYGANEKHRPALIASNRDARSRVRAWMTSAFRPKLNTPVAHLSDG